MLTPNDNSSNKPDNVTSKHKEKDILEQFMSAKFKKVTIDQPFQIFNETVLEEKNRIVNYGILELLKGNWYSYVEVVEEVDNDKKAKAKVYPKRVSNIRDGEFKDNYGSGIHTTIMPSPGTTQNNIPGKFSFECDEYIEKLSFDLVEGGVRNRGGANEQFCGAVKYEQSIKGLIANKFVEELLIGLQVDYINQKIDKANKEIDEACKEIVEVNIEFDNKQKAIKDNNIKIEKIEKQLELKEIISVASYLYLTTDDFKLALNSIDDKNFPLNRLLCVDLKKIIDDLQSVAGQLNNNITQLGGVSDCDDLFVINCLYISLLNRLTSLIELCKSLIPLLSNLKNLLKKASSQEIIDNLIPSNNILKDFLLKEDKPPQGIHEENGMYLWLSDLYKNPATEESIKKDRGVHNWNNEKGRGELFKNLYGTDDKIVSLEKELSLIQSSPDSEKRKKEIEDLIKDLNLAKPKQIKELSAILDVYPFLDVTLFNINNSDIPSYKTSDSLTKDEIICSIVPAKELQPGEGIDRPTFVPDYSISRSGVIPHGSTITLLGDLKREAGSFLIKGEPMFVNPNLGTWDKAHLALTDTMGTGISPTNSSRPFDLYNPPLPFTPTEDFNEENDPGEEEVYTQQLFQHNLYPYSVRPDLRLRDAIRNQNIKNHVRIEMFSKKDNGAQGGIVNIPFVNRFVPTVNMKMNMWLETVVEGDKEVLQLQYEQIVFFEFGFGDGGGTTSWPHIQVNTLRHYKDLNEYSKELAEKFDCPEASLQNEPSNKNTTPKEIKSMSHSHSKCPINHN